MLEFYIKTCNLEDCASEFVLKLRARGNVRTLILKTVRIQKMVCLDTVSENDTVIVWGNCKRMETKLLSSDEQ